MNNLIHTFLPKITHNEKVSGTLLFKIFLNLNCICVLGVSTFLRIYASWDADVLLARCHDVK